MTRAISDMPVELAAENALIERLLARDEAAFSDLVAKFHNPLIRLARTLVADLGAAEDVVQETWLGVLKGLQSFERRCSLRTWIYRILLNRGRARGSRDRLVPFSALEDWNQPLAIGREKNPEGLLLRREAIEWLHEAIASLPRAQRAVIVLRDIKGIDGPGVCSILAISEINQRVLLHRARTKTRAALENHSPKKPRTQTG